MSPLEIKLFKTAMVCGYTVLWFNPPPVITSEYLLVRSIGFVAAITLIIANAIQLITKK